MTTALDDAMIELTTFVTQAGCKALPSARLIFDTPADQAVFKLLFVKNMNPNDVAAAPIGSDKFIISGVAVELYNRDRGSRALAEKMLNAARKALEDGRKRTIGQAEIIAMRQSLSDLLQLIEG